MNIRRYTHKDFETIQSWCRNLVMEPINHNSLPPTTYIAEADGIPMVCLSLIATNVDKAYLEYAIGNPEAKGPARREAFKHLVQYVEGIAKGLGYRYLMCLAPNDYLGAYYHTHGYQVNMPDLTLMLKELK